MRDEFEPDDAYEDAKPIAIGETQTHNLYPDGDVDMVWFGVKEGLLYALGTSNLTLGTDTFITVTVNGTICEETDYYRCVNDDIGPGFLESEVRFVPELDATAVATITKGISGFYGPDKTYDLDLTLLSVDVDKYEPDEIRPKSIAYDETQDHNFYPDYDVDKVKFPAKAGYWYDIYTSDLALDVDTVMTVGTDVYFNDDMSETNPASKVTFFTAGDATAVVTITDFAGRGGPDHWYKITVEQLVDDFEPDDTDETANPISIGETQIHNLRPEGDYRYSMVWGQEGAFVCPWYRISGSLARGLLCQPPAGGVTGAHPPGVR